MMSVGVRSRLCSALVPNRKKTNQLKRRKRAIVRGCAAIGIDMFGNGNSSVLSANGNGAVLRLFCGMLSIHRATVSPLNLLSII